MADVSRHVPPVDQFHKRPSCCIIQLYHQTLVIAIQLVVVVLLIMHVYAMYDRKRWVIWLFITIARVDIAVGCLGIVSNSPNCHPSNHIACAGMYRPSG